MAEVFAQRIAHLQMEAFGLSFSDKIGSVVQKGIGVAHAFIKNETKEDLKLTMKSLHHERNDVYGWDRNRDDPMRKQIYALCESLEIILNCKLSSVEAKQADSQNEATEIAVEPADPANTLELAVVEPSANIGTVENQEPIDFTEPSEEINGQQLRLVIPKDDATAPANDALKNVPKEEDTVVRMLEGTYNGEMKEEYVDQLIGTIGKILQSTPLENNSAAGMDKEGKILLDGENERNEDIVDETEHPLNETETKRTKRNPRKRTMFEFESMEETVEEDDEDVEEEMDNNDIENDFMDDSDGSYHPVHSRGVNSTPRRSNNKKRRDGKGSGKSNKRRSKIVTPKTMDMSPNNESTRPFKCDQCTCSYSRQHQLKLHIRATHAATEEARKPFQCQVCGKRSIKNSDLRRHMKVHSDDLLVKKPFQCINCETRFYSKAGLKTHSAKCR